MREVHTAATSAQVGHLVRRALTFLETDRAAAWRCLRDASTLLVAESTESCDESQRTRNDLRPGGLPHWRTKRALEYIEANLGSKIEICDVADCVSLSRAHFSRAFKESLGSSPMVYVSMMRVERAKLMMTSTLDPLSDIALACGFADQSHLTRQFRRVVGISPGVWRRTVASPKRMAVSERGVRRSDAVNE